MKDDGNVVVNDVPKVSLLVSGTSVFPCVMAVIPHLFTPWFKAFQTDVAHPTKLSPLFQHKKFHQLLGKHMVESLGFLLDVITKDFHAILASKELQQTINLSIHESGLHAKSRGNMAVNFPGIGSFRIEVSLILQTLENCFQVTIDEHST